MITKVRTTKKFSVYELVDSDSIEKREIKKLIELFDEIIGETNTYTIARTISRQEREETNSLDKGYLTYGEASFPLIQSVFETILSDDITFNTVHPRNFVDLGSGSGRTSLMVCCLQHIIQFRNVSGIEILDSLYQMSNDIKKRFDTFNKSQIDQFFTSQLKFYKGSIFDLSVYDWTTNDVIFVNSTCFSDEMMLQIYNYTKKTRTGTYIISFTFPLYNIKPIILDLVRELRLETSWGSADVFIQKKI
jgi:hypothetical protein